MLGLNSQALTDLQADKTPVPCKVFQEIGLEVLMPMVFAATIAALPTAVCSLSMSEGNVFYKKAFLEGKNGKVQGVSSKEVFTDKASQQAQR